MATKGRPQIWFFDDGIHNAPKENKDDIIHFELINSSGPPKHYGNVSKHFYDIAPDSKFVTMNMDTDYMDPESGIQEAEIFKLKDAAQKGEVLAAVFDWDRTLTMFEGIYAPVDMITDNIKQYKESLARKYTSMQGFEDFTDQDIAHYYFHNPADGDRGEDVKKRPHLIATMLRDLQTMGIPIFILTNNSAGKVIDGVRDQRGFLMDILKKLGVDIPKDHIIFNYAKNKEKMIMDVILPMVERKKGGRRTRNYRKSAKKRRTYKKKRVRKIKTHKKRKGKKVKKGKKTKGRH